MYSYFKGKIVVKSPVQVVIDCNGIGYEFKISLNTYSKIMSEKECKLYSHLSIKEDAHTLYGFFEESERLVFRLLISVNGVGANTAMLILSSFTPSELSMAVMTDDVNKIKSVKGIGLKTAQRILIELKDKLDKEVGSGQIISISHNTNKLEALSALSMLGFNKAQTDKTLDKVIKEIGSETSVEELIKHCLKLM